MIILNLGKHWFHHVSPHPVTNTTRIIPFLVWNPYNPSRPTGTGWGGLDPRETSMIWRDVKRSRRNDCEWTSRSLKTLIYQISNHVDWWPTISCGIHLLGGCAWSTCAQRVRKSVERRHCRPSRGPKQWTHTEVHADMARFIWISSTTLCTCQLFLVQKIQEQQTIDNSVGSGSLLLSTSPPKKNTSPNHSGQKSSMLGSMSLVSPLQRLHRNFSNTRQWPAWICDCWMLGTNWTKKSSPQMVDFSQWLCHLYGD